MRCFAGYKQQALDELSGFIENMDSTVRLSFVKDSSTTGSGGSGGLRESSKDLSLSLLRERASTTFAPASFGMTLLDGGSGSGSGSQQAGSVGAGLSGADNKLNERNLAALGFNMTRSTKGTNSTNGSLLEVYAGGAGAGNDSARSSGGNGNGTAGINSGGSFYESFPSDEKAFRVQCLLKRAEWLREENAAFAEVLKTVQEARELAPDQYSVWHEWAVTNYNQLQKVDFIDYSMPIATGRSGGETRRDVRSFSMTSNTSSSSGGNSATRGTSNEAKQSESRDYSSFLNANSLRTTPQNRHAHVTGNDSSAASAGAVVATGGNGGALKNRPPRGEINTRESSGGSSSSLASQSQPLTSLSSQTTLGRDAAKKLKFSESTSKTTIVHGMTLANLVSVENKDAETEAMKYATEAIKGFVKSIIYGTGQPVANLLQDTLRLLTLWFSYGAKDSIFNLLKTELDRIAPQYWLRVIPQLIARMHVKSTKISELLRKLLIRLADSHPQALVCPISVALNTTHAQQKKMAQDVLKEMRRNKGNYNSIYLLFIANCARTNGLF